MSTLTVHFAANDDQGSPSDLVERIEVYTRPDNCILSLEGQAHYAEHEGNRWLSVGHCLVNYQGVIGRRVGNMCWNAVEMEPFELHTLLCHLKRLGWTINEADETLWRAWDAGEIRVADLAWAVEQFGVMA